MSYTYRPATRQNTPLIIGIAGPTKSGKTFSALRLARGLAQDAPVVMINAEGARGHQYSDQFDYLATDLEAPYRPEKYTEALQAAVGLQPRPGAVIIDSCSHMHNGPGGILEWKEEELDRLAGKDANWKTRERYNWTAWIRPKAAETAFVYTMLSADVPLILCFRAKEKMKIESGKDPVPLGWQPIVGEAVAFETIFTLILPPHSKGVPDLSKSEMREPFDALIPAGQNLTEETGAALARWAAGTAAKPSKHDERIKDLTDELLTCADALGNRSQVLAAVAKNRRQHATNLAKHVEWLNQQLHRLTDAVQAREEEQIQLPAGTEE